MFDAIKDVLESVRKVEIWGHFAISDTRARYARSVLGPLWITLGTALGVVGLSLVWSNVMGIPLEKMLPNLAVGLVTWFFISGVLTESSSCFINQSAIIKNYSGIPLYIHVLRLLTKHFINFLHNTLIVFLVILYFRTSDLAGVALSFVGVIFLVLNMAWLSLLLAVIGSKYRDLAPSIEALMPILFFLMPILYRKADISGTQLWYDLNPLAHLFSIVKDPLLAIDFDLASYQWAFFTLIIGWSISLFVYNKSIKNIPFWI